MTAVGIATWQAAQSHPDDIWGQTLINLEDYANAILNLGQG